MSGSGLPTAAARPALRVPAFGWGEDDIPTHVLRIDPADGTVGVFGDAPVVALLSRPVDRWSVTGESFVVTRGAEPVAGTVGTSPDGQAIVWTPAHPLCAGVEHRVRATGLRDSRGRPVTTHESSFVPCDLKLSDLFG
jgi:hypothetical protein